MKAWTGGSFSKKSYGVTRGFNSEGSGGGPQSSSEPSTSSMGRGGRPSTMSSHMILRMIWPCVSNAKSTSYHSPSWSKLESASMALPILSSFVRAVRPSESKTATWSDACCKSGFVTFHVKSSSHMGSSVAFCTLEVRFSPIRVKRTYGSDVPPLSAASSPTPSTRFSRKRTLSPPFARGFRLKSRPLMDRLCVSTKCHQPATSSVPCVSSFTLTVFIASSMNSERERLALPRWSALAVRPS
mmetsp:Transcript_40605/g.100829  ORF Transcript_40605/g.100829 Transcript_40605/m.100829 type:complete len:242 (+) Transcript_40605:3866-4591(+)